MIGAAGNRVCVSATSEERDISRKLTMTTVALSGMAAAVGALTLIMSLPGALLVGGFILGWTQLGGT